MKEHSHHGNNGHHSHHRKSSSAHTEHINILDKLGNSIKDEVKRGLELIDTSVNQLAQAKWILINIEKTLEDSYSDCPVCHSQAYKSAGKQVHTSPVKIKPYSNEPLLIIKKEDIISSPPQKSKILNCPKPGPKSKTRQVENEKQIQKTETEKQIRKTETEKQIQKTETEKHSPSLGCSTTKRPPCNYSKEKSFSTRKSEKDKPLIKLSDISNVIRGRKRVNLNDYPSLQGPKQKKQKISVSNDDSDSDAVSYSTLKRKKPKHKGSVSDDGSDGSYSLSSILKRKKPKHKASVSDDGSDGSYALSTSKKKKPKSPKFIPNKKYKSKEIITSDDSDSDEGKKLEAIRKKKHKHRHDKDKHDRDRNKPKSKVKEFGSKSDFLERMSVTKSVCGSDVSKSTSKADKHEKRRKSDSPDRRDSKRDDKEHKVKVRKDDKEKGSKHREEKSKKIDSDDDEVVDQALRDEVSKIDFDDNSSEDEKPKSVVDDKSKKSERKSIDIKEKQKENDSDSVKNTVNCKLANERHEKSDTKENAPIGKGDISKCDTKEKPEKDKTSIKAMLLSKAKPDLQQKLLEKFKQFAATRKAPAETKPVTPKTGETKEMEAIGLTIEKENKSEKREEGISNSILTSIQPPMALQDMIEQDEMNEKRGSGDSVDEFIKSVLQNNNDTVTENEILKILKENYLIEENNKVVELKEETQTKFKATIRQFQSVVVAHLQGGPTSTGNKVDSGGDEASSNSDDTSHTVGAQGTSGNTITNNEQGNVVILNDSQLPSGELTVGNYFLIGREGYPLQLMKYIGGNNFEPLQMSNFTPQQLNAVKNSLI